MSVYKQNGFADRNEYLQSLAEDYDIAVETVYALAELLGPSEDFDGLVSALDNDENLLF